MEERTAITTAAIIEMIGVNIDKVHHKLLLFWIFVGRVEEVEVDEEEETPWILKYKKPKMSNNIARRNVQGATCFDFGGWQLNGRKHNCDE